MHGVSRMSDATPDRGLSYTLNYVFGMAIAALLVSGLIVAGGTFVDERRTDVVRGELRVIGNHLAANIEQADRMVVASENADTVSINRTFPERATGTTYSVELDPPNDRLVLSTTSLDVEVTVSLETETDLGQSTVNGGSVAVVYDSSADELVIRHGT